jgi:hypothetical protein
MRLRLALRVVAASVLAWLIVIALLGATLHFLPVTPGYLPDHME